MSQEDTPLVYVSPFVAFLVLLWPRFHFYFNYNYIIFVFLSLGGLISTSHATWPWRVPVPLSPSLVIFALCFTLNLYIFTHLGHGWPKPWPLRSVTSGLVPLACFLRPSCQLFFSFIFEFIVPMASRPSGTCTSLFRLFVLVLLPVLLVHLFLSNLPYFFTPVYPLSMALSPFN